MTSCPLVAALAVTLAGCELQEVTTAEPAAFVVAEVVLQAGAERQLAYLQSGLGPADLRVRDARIVVSAVSGADSLVYEETGAWRCISPLPEQDDVLGSCYEAVGPGVVRPGERYRLHIGLADGGVLEGETQVPQPLQLLQPAVDECALAPETPLELLWREASGAWVYAVEAQFQDIFPVLVERGVVADTPNIPLRLSGFAISATDTTLVLPGELGLFDRFNADVHPILLALRGGLPAGVSGEVVVAAADRNYVNWARGGSFNPSGVVRIPSVRGAGTGVFGAITSDGFRLVVSEDSDLPGCR